jgi:hypothetical protein
MEKQNSRIAGVAERLGRKHEAAEALEPGDCHN